MWYAQQDSVHVKLHAKQSAPLERYRATGPCLDGYNPNVILTEITTVKSPDAF